MKKLYKSIFYLMALLLVSISTLAFGFKENVNNENKAFAENTDRQIQHYNRYFQNATAYVAPPGAVTASNTTPTKGIVAVHPNTYSSNNSIAINSGPVIPFGTLLLINENYSEIKYIIYPGDTLKYKMFFVRDLGQLQHQQNYSKYWVDFYFGVNNTTNENAAIAFGNNKTISYSYYAPV